LTSKDRLWRRIPVQNPLYPNILAFEYLDGRHANLAPGSPDLPKIADTLTRLGQIPAPELPLRRLQDRWAGLGEDSALTLLAGDQLLHTDLNPLQHPHRRARAHRRLGLAHPRSCLDRCGLRRPVVIADGDSPAAAEIWAAGIRAWATASRPGIDVFTTISCRLWGQIAHDDPQPWKLRLHAATQAGAAHRMTAMSATG
jgi:hypothetical protein